MASKSMDQEQMLLIVVLVGALLYMFMKNHKGGICSLFGGNKETYIIGGQANATELQAQEKLMFDRIPLTPLHLSLPGKGN